MTFRAICRQVLAAEELGVLGMLEGGESEGPGAVAARTGGAELTAVYVFVARDAVGFQTAIVEHRFRLCIRRGLLLVAGDALDLGVALFERKLGPRSVIEFCTLESGHGVARFAGFLKGPFVGVLVTVAASLEAELLSGCVARAVAFGTGE